jgi:hypothetical protein
MSMMKLAGLLCLDIVIFLAFVLANLLNGIFHLIVLPQLFHAATLQSIPPLDSAVASDAQTVPSGVRHRGSFQPPTLTHVRPLWPVSLPGESKFIDDLHQVAAKLTLRSY